VTPTGSPPCAGRAVVEHHRLGERLQQAGTGKDAVEQPRFQERLAPRLVDHIAGTQAQVGRLIPAGQISLQPGRPGTCTYGR